MATKPHDEQSEPDKQVNSEDEEKNLGRDEVQRSISHDRDHHPESQTHTTQSPIDCHEWNRTKGILLYGSMTRKMIAGMIVT